MINEGAVAKHIREGLQGKTLKDTFLVHFIGFLALLILGLFIQHYWGIERLLKLTPILVAAVVVMEYGIAWFPWDPVFVKVRDFLRSLDERPAEALSEPSFSTIKWDPETLWLTRPLADGERDVLSIQLWSPEMSESRDKLHQIYQLYSECDFILGTSHKYHSGRLAKIELGSGNLRAKLFGEFVVISLVATLIEATVSYLHRTYAEEGRRADISLNALESIINLEAKLKEAGADTSEMKGQISKSAIRISRQLDELLSDEYLVKVNEKVFQLNEHEQYEPNSPRRLIVVRNEK